MKIQHNNQVLDIKLGNVSYDHDYWCDTYIESCYNETEKRELSGHELDELEKDLELEMPDLIMQWLY